MAVTFMEDRAGDAGVEIDRYLIAAVRTPWVEPTAADSATTSPDGDGSKWPTTRSTDVVEFRVLGVYFFSVKYHREIAREV
jgi:hypothetical protein